MLTKVTDIIYIDLDKIVALEKVAGMNGSIEVRVFCPIHNGYSGWFQVRGDDAFMLLKMLGLEKS